MNPFSWIYTNIIKKVVNFILSDRTKNAVEQATDLINIALPVVESLSKINTKTAKIEDVVNAYKTYGVPIVATYTENPTSIGNALLNLATDVLRQKLPAEKANIATHILNTAVQLALTIVKNK